MNVKSNSQRVVGLGEVLWDLLPGGKKLGGAPANFACHAHMLGAEAFVVSAVGRDCLGLEICERIDRLGLNRDGLTISEKYPTGTVKVELDGEGKPHYIIHEDVAWDFLGWTPALEKLASQADAVCFGSLGQRGPVSRHNIRKFLSSTRADCLRVFDINLRQSYYTPEVLRTSLAASNVLKLNDEELLVVAGLLEVSGTQEEMLKQLLVSFELELVALTRGEHGSRMVTPTETSNCRGTLVEVQDTVGAGDAFAAAMVVGMLRGLPLQVVNDAACRIGAFVCSQAGAVPSLPPELVNKLMS